MVSYVSVEKEGLSVRCRMVKRKENIKLVKQDWIDAGIKVLAESGVALVRVEPLAKLLNVTKGSFYWHFKNREELLEAMLQDWISRETDGIIEQIESGVEDAATKLLHILERVTQREHGQVENAVRAWANSDAKVTTILDQVDQRRLDYTKTLFLEVGFTPFESMVRSRMFYYSLVGEFILGIQVNRIERLIEIGHQHLIFVHRG